ncbi:MAG: hypothetical protein FJ125_03895 [Deltaproteobacteria bacterium]|nr:hypothetical protein [Deltaproteobacteria bacterium]
MNMPETLRDSLLFSGTRQDDLHPKVKRSHPPAQSTCLDNHNWMRYLHAMIRPARQPDQQDASTGFPIAPTIDEWQAMTPAAQDELIQRIIIAMAERVELMAEGRQHSRARGAALDP